MGVRPAGACRGRNARDYFAALGCGRAGPDGDGRRDPRPEARAVYPVVASARGRRAQHRRSRRRRHVFSGGCSPRRSVAAAPRAGRGCRVTGCPRALSTRPLKPGCGRRCRDCIGRTAAGARFRRGAGRRSAVRRRRGRSSASRRRWCWRCRRRLRRARSRPRRPDDHAPIVNAHYRVAAPAGAPSFVGVVGGVAEWVFRKREVLSVTVSAADGFVDRPAEELGEMLWRDVAAATHRAGPPPPARIVKERRATFRASPAQLRGGRRRRHAGAIFCLPAIMSIPACPRRSKALFAPGSPRPGCWSRTDAAAAWSRTAASAGSDPRAVAPSNPGRPSRAAMTDDYRAPTSGGRPRRRTRRLRGLDRAIERATGSLLALAARRRASGCSSSRPTRRSRPNISCCSITSARRTRAADRHRPHICAPLRARMAGGRCSSAARSTLAARSRRISR